MTPLIARARRTGNEPYRPIAAALHLPLDHVAAIDRSHERCATLGLLRFEQPDLSPLSRADLGIARERTQRLHAHALPIMEMLFEQIMQTQSMVVLCDATGTIIRSIGDADFQARASQVALAPGVNWSEQTKGTNAIGTALVAEGPTLVHADEHFMHANHFLTCSAAPILDPRGNILGVLDVTGDRSSYHPHTMALVRMSARMIENHWLSDDYRHFMRLHFHSRADFIGTLMEGILAVAPDGRIVGANHSALDQLAMSGAAVRMHSLPSLLGTSVNALVEHFRAPLALPLTAFTPDGRPLHVAARFNWPAWQGGFDIPAQAPPPAAAAIDSQIAAVPNGMAAVASGDPQMAALTAKVRRVIDRDIPILIVGETGSGKESLARAIHDESQRRRQPFVAVRCAAIADSMIEAELFGCAPGSADGTRHESTTGRILQADGGTLYLEEVGALPFAVQSRLLRVLQERQVHPADGSTAVTVDVAIVCSTRRSLRELIGAQSFCEHLYFRLNGLSVHLPALRQRSDIVVLATRILEREAAPRRLALSGEVAALLTQARWPGNVRQLYNVIRAACAIAAGDSTIRREHLPDDFLDEIRAEQATMPGAQMQALAPPDEPKRSLGAIELEAIRTALAAAGGNISEAAKCLGISRNTIYRKLRVHGQHA